MAFAFGLFGFELVMVLIPAAILMVAGFMYSGIKIEAVGRPALFRVFVVLSLWNFGGAFICWGVGRIVANL